MGLICVNLTFDGVTLVNAVDPNRERGAQVEIRESTQDGKRKKQEIDIE